MQLKEANDIIEDFDRDLDNTTDKDLLYQKYTEYKKNVQHLLNRKSCYIENLKNRIKKELVDEHEM